MRLLTNLRSSPLPPLVVAALVTLAGIGWALTGDGLGRGQTAAGGALLLLLLAAAGWAVKGRGEGEDSTAAAESRSGSVPPVAERGSLDRIGRRLAAAERPAAVQQAGLHDALTRLPGRALLQELLHRQLVQARRSGELLGLILCDVDNLRAVNQGHGQTVGDRLLQEVARRLSRDVREADTVARTGEDEFTLTLGRVDTVADIWLVAERLLAGAREPVSIDGREVQVSLSVGLSVFPADGRSLEELLGKAEAALAEARRLGGDRVHAFAAESG